MTHGSRRERRRVPLREKLATKAVEQCARVLASFEEDRGPDVEELWRIITNAHRDGLDVYQLAWKLDYYAWQCTTGYMDLAIAARNSLTADWLYRARKEIGNGRKNRQALRRRTS